MTVSELIARLQKIQDKEGDIVVMTNDRDDSGPFSIDSVEFREVEEDDEYPRVGICRKVSNLLKLRKIFKCRIVWLPVR